MSSVVNSSCVVYESSLSSSSLPTSSSPNSLPEIYYHINWDTLNIYCNCPKSKTVWFYNAVMCSKDINGMANSVDPDNIAPLRAVLSGSALFAQTVSIYRILMVL